MNPEKMEHRHLDREVVEKYVSAQNCTAREKAL